MLKISDHLSLPIDAITSTFAIMALRGVGKTHTASVMAEEMLKVGQPVCIYDPTGAWNGLKSSADGKREGFAVVIFGGDRADLPLEETAGETIARAIVERRFPAILDCSLMRKGARVRFMVDFAETLYRLNREPLHLFLDEAHTLAPRESRGSNPGLSMLLGAIEDIVLQGRRKGLGITVISQRPALVHTNVRTQCETLIAMRIVAPHDLKAIREWVEVHATLEQASEMMKSLPTLEVGEGWVWSPSYLRLFKRTRFRQRETFDSSATPKIGKRVVMPKVVASIDLAALGEQIASTVETAKANDPKELKRQIAELKKQLAARPKEVAKTVEKIVEVEVPVLKNGQLDRTEKVIERLQAAVEKVTGETQELRRLVAAAVAPKPKPVVPPRQPAVAAPASTPRPRAIPRPASDSQTTDRDPSLGKSGKRRMLAALAQYPAGLSAPKLSILSGIKRRGGTWRTYLGDLKASGYVETRGDLLTVTDAGLAALGSYEPLPTGQGLVEYWRSELGSSGLRTLFDAILDVYPDGLTKSGLAERTGIAEGGGTFRTYLGKLRTLELVDLRDGYLFASDTFFE